jgi:hypothetical protein
MICLRNTGSGSRLRTRCWSRTYPWVQKMRTRVGKLAHVLERIGLSMAGAASGLFVGVHVGSNIPALTSQWFLLIMMVTGAVGFYLGIDTPPAPFHPT